MFSGFKVLIRHTPYWECSSRCFRMIHAYSERDVFASSCFSISFIDFIERQEKSGNRLDFILFMIAFFVGD